MDNPICSACGSKMKRNGHTSSGATRWRCKACGASCTHRIDTAAKRLAEFLSWLMGKSAQSEMPGEGRTFRRRTSEFWDIWPIAPWTGEVCDIVFLDGIWIGRDAVVLIACTRNHVLAWHLAQSECAETWAALMMRIPAPAMAVSDGAPGLAKATRAVWPKTRMQRCTFHAFCQVKRCTTSRPKLDAGVEPYSLAKRLLKAKDADAAAAWLADYASWCSKWERFLREFTLKDGRKQYVHERLRKARHALNRLVRSGELFTFVEMAQEHGGMWDSTNNMIEGGVNARLREMLRMHRGCRPYAASRRSSGGATCTQSRRFLPQRSCASCPPMTKWKGSSHQLPESTSATMERPQNTDRGSSGASSICLLNTDGE